MHLKEGLELCWLSWKLWFPPLLYEMGMVSFDSEIQKTLGIIWACAYTCTVCVCVWYDRCVYRLWRARHLIFEDFHGFIMRVRLFYKHPSIPFPTHTRITSKPKLIKKTLRLNELYLWIADPVGVLVLAGWCCLIMSLMLWLGSMCSAFVGLDCTTSSGGGPRV